MLPVYTRYLTPEDYGTIELISVALDLTLLLLGARVAVGVFKYYSDAPTRSEKNQVIVTALALMAGVHFAAVVIIAFFNQPIARLLDASHDFGIALSIYAVSAIFAAINEVFFSYLKILDRAITYVGINLLKLVIQLSLNIYLIAYLQMNYWGVIWSAVISSVLISTLFAAYLLPSIGLKISRDYTKKLIQFSLPIIVASLAMYYITFSSRYYLQFFRNIDAVGIYALANKFGMMLFSLVAVPFSEYWSARQFDMAKTEQADKLFGNVFFYMALILFGAATGLVALVSDFVHISASQPYWPAIPIIPWLVGSYMLQAWGDYFRFGCFYANKNRFITYASFATVLVITALYLFWIPEQGALGAGKAIFVANAIRFAIIYIYGQRLFRMDVPWVRIAACFLYFGVATFLISLIQLSGFYALIVKASATCIAFAAVFITPIVALEHRKLIFSKASQLWAKKLAG
jgi:O-antigen/teichoic acid export membrane protein